MYRLRSWSVRHARGLRAIYRMLERSLAAADPLLRRIGYARLDRPVLLLERFTKGVLLGSRECGQCIVSSTGMACPMNCPKTLRNGPCGGVRADGTCEVKAGMPCVWVLAWQGNQRLASRDWPIQVVQPPLDHRLHGTSAWLRAARNRAGSIPLRLESAP